MTRMPALFLGHGAPPLLDDAQWMAELKSWADVLPRPESIVIISAHWEAAPAAISAFHAPLVYDFSGFPDRFYHLTYDTPLAENLAASVAGVLPAHQHSQRGLDHGAWVPLMAMYPDADIPVLQLSLPSQSPSALLELGAKLRPLRDEGVLIIGSGFMTHGLRHLSPANWAGDHTPPGWSRDFDDWAADALARGDVETLSDFRSAPGMPYAHPTVEHLTPLYVTLGAADDPSAPTDQVIEGYFMGLSKRSLQTA